ncbi:Ran-binding protein 1 [Perkinsela sp. CCAP 1560/4]|nr:Ran-binding protein 1 [Perkinsela sp. CCAP 1560/4]|eukprot:KNH07607.1 Ran-binding protein 1 [Perkinsela sp. CCAP 1560/4]
MYVHLFISLVRPIIYFMASEKKLFESLVNFKLGDFDKKEKDAEKLNSTQGDTSELVEEEELCVTDGGKALLSAIEVKTGEEEEEVIYREKAKVFRFDEGENKWKERGAGEARILQDKIDRTRFRFILRREGTGKLGANHYLLKSMKLMKSGSNEKSWLWSTPADCSDEEVQPELFTLRFAAKELAQAFRKVFEECVLKCKE